MDFAVSPGSLGAHASGAVLLESEARIDIRAPSGAKGEPTEPYARMRHRRRYLVTGGEGAGLGRFVIAAARGERLEHVVARLSKKAGGTVHAEPLPPSEESRQAPPDVTVDLGSAAPGDIIDTYIERTYPDVDLLPPFSHSDAGPAVASTLTIEAPMSFDVRFAMGKGTAVERAPRARKLDLGGGRLAWVFEERDVPPAGWGPLAADPQRSGPWVAAVVAAVELAGAKQMRADSWKTVGARLVQRLSPTMAVDASFTQQIPQGLPIARLRALRRMFRPKSVPALWSAAPRPFAELGGEATPLEMAALAVAAGKGGIEKIHLALAAPNGGAVLVEQLPGLYAFSHVLVAFREDGGWRFADLGCANCAIDQLPTGLAGGRALVLTDGGGEVAEVPLRGLEPNSASLQFDWTLSVQGELTGKLLADLEGMPARRAAEAIARGSSEALAAARALLIGEGPQLRELDEEGTLVPEQPYPLRFGASAQVQAGADGTFTATGATLAGQALPWADAPAQGVLRLPAPVRVASTATIQMPPGYDAEAMKPLRVQSPLGEYEARLERHGSVLTYTRRIKVFPHLVEAASLLEWKKLVEAFRAADGIPIVMKAE